jgi:hypothetical protein
VVQRIGAEGEAMKASTPALAALALGALGLSGCLFGGGDYSHAVFETVHDDQLTFDDYDGTVRYEAAPDEIYAPPPVEVHEFDDAAVIAGGGVKVIDGSDWLRASNWQRNALLNKAELGQPKGTIFVLVVATGAVWKIPPASDALITAGTIKEWQGHEYDRLDEYVGQQYKATVMTLRRFAGLSNLDNSPDLGAIHYLHDLGPFGVKDIDTAHGFQVMLRKDWLTATPDQRFLKLLSIQNYIQHLPAFQADGYGPSFGVTIPWGTVYAVPEHNLDKLIGGGAIKAWTDEQVGSLQSVIPGPPHWARQDEKTIVPTLGVTRKF